MIDLGDKVILIRNQEGYEKVLEKLRKQAYRWVGREDLECIQTDLPFALNVDGGDKTVEALDISPYGYKVCEASDLLEEKEMTAREFVEWMGRAGQCDERDCRKCMLSDCNTKSEFACCSIKEWHGNEDEVLELAKADRITIDEEAEEETDIEESLESLIKDKSSSEILQYIGYLIEKLKEKE